MVWQKEYKNHTIKPRDIKKKNRNDLKSATTSTQQYQQQLQKSSVEQYKMLKDDFDDKYQH